MSLRSDLATKLLRVSLAGPIVAWSVHPATVLQESDLLRQTLVRLKHASEKGVEAVVGLPAPVLRSALRVASRTARRRTRDVDLHEFVQSLFVDYDAGQPPAPIDADLRHLFQDAEARDPVRALSTALELASVSVLTTPSPIFMQGAPLVGRLLEAGQMSGQQRVDRLWDVLSRMERPLKEGLLAVQSLLDQAQGMTDTAVKSSSLGALIRNVRSHPGYSAYASLESFLPFAGRMRNAIDHGCHSYNRERDEVTYWDKDRAAETITGAELMSRAKAVVVFITGALPMSAAWFALNSKSVKVVAERLGSRDELFDTLDGLVSEDRAVRVRAQAAMKVVVSSCGEALRQVIEAANASAPT